MCGSTGLIARNVLKLFNQASQVHILVLLILNLVIEDAVWCDSVFDNLLVGQVEVQKSLIDLVFVGEDLRILKESQEVVFLLVFSMLFLIDAEVLAKLSETGEL